MANIVNKCHNSNTHIYFDIYGLKSLFLAKKLKADGIKISISDLYNKPLISKAFKLFDNVLLSISGTHPTEIKDLLSALQLPKI